MVYHYGWGIFCDSHLCDPFCDWNSGVDINIYSLNYSFPNGLSNCWLHIFHYSILYSTDNTFACCLLTKTEHMSLCFYGMQMYKCNLCMWLWFQKQVKWPLVFMVYRWWASSSQDSHSLEHGAVLMNSIELTLRFSLSLHSSSSPFAMLRHKRWVVVMVFVCVCLCMHTYAWVHVHMHVCFWVRDNDLVYYDTNRIRKLIYLFKFSSHPKEEEQF